MALRPLKGHQGLSSDGTPLRKDEATLSRVSSNQKTKALGVESSNAAALNVHTNRPAIEQSATGLLTPQIQRVVLPDPVAFRYLGEDPSVKVIERRQVLRGYELYLVEQWACSRKSPTVVITAYTGDSKDSVVVGVLGIPADDKTWSPRSRVYFKAIQQYHARPKKTALGELMITNLSSFPSALTVIPVPDGDIRKHRHMFIVNEDLKRLGCSGRSGMTLSEPTSATQAKFLQLYKTSESIPFLQAVPELVRLCQIALFLFDKLGQEYIDGLLCDITEMAINSWWTEIGSEHYNIEPTDGILGPTTIAALLGTLIGARNRLSSFGAPIGKDVFDVESTKKAIGIFQKSCKLGRTRRLNRPTLLTLHRETAKAAAGESGWRVQKAVKSTVAEIGGTRGELVIGMVAGRDKANIGDVETLDLDKFIGLIHGERAKWLWRGKHKKPGQDHNHSLPETGGFLHGKEKEDGPASTQAVKRAQSEIEEREKKEFPGLIYSAPAPGSALSMLESSSGDKDALRKNIFKSVAGKVNDARSGLGRIRDVVGGGLKGHVSRVSRDEASSGDGLPSAMSSPKIGIVAQSSAAPLRHVVAGRASTWKNKPEEILNAHRTDKESAEAASRVPILPMASEPPLSYSAAISRRGSLQFPGAILKLQPSERAPTSETEACAEPQATDPLPDSVVSDSSVAASVLDGGDSMKPALASAIEHLCRTTPALLRRRHTMASLSSLVYERKTPWFVNEARFPRRLSFSEAEDAVLQWGEIVDMLGPGDNSIFDTADGGKVDSHQSAEVASALLGRLAALQRKMAPWASAKVASLEHLDQELAAQQAELQSLGWSLPETYERMRVGAEEQLGEEMARFDAGVREIETLAARLEYEIGLLEGRVRDLEDGVVRLESVVVDVERRATELKAVLGTESWLHWFVRKVTGIGTGPNITRGGG